MIYYWLCWILLTILKGSLLAGSVYATIGGILHFNNYVLLVVFVPLSIFFLRDFIYQLLVPITGGVGNRLSKPSDTPIYMGLAPSYKEAREALRKGECIIWE